MAFFKKKTDLDNWEQERIEIRKNLHSIYEKLELDKDKNSNFFITYQQRIGLEEEGKLLRSRLHKLDKWIKAEINDSKK